MRWSGTERPALVIGYGNSLRRDDGAGLVLAESLVNRWLSLGLPAEILTAHQLSPELAEDIAESDAELVLFVDAAVASEAGEARIGLAQLDPTSLSPAFGHHLGPAGVLAYARELYGYQGAGWVCSVPGNDFAHGEGLSYSTQALIDAFLSRDQLVWKALQETSASASHSPPQR